MAAYGLAERFPTPRDCNRIYDPGAYNIPGLAHGFKQNKYPFLSSTPRKTQVTGPSYTDSIYDADIKPKIPNVTSLMSKQPRFPYEAFSPEDLQELICRCQMECECPSDEQKPKDEAPVCQAKVPKRLFKGPPPHASLGMGISCPCKWDHGFELLPDGSMKRLLCKPVDDQPFYETRVHWSTDFYQGCKWSKWVSKREIKTGEVRPGPADYTLRREKSQYEKCLDKLKAKRRKYSRLLRFVEQIQEIGKGRPGPADYDAKLPKCTELKFLGPKAERFPVSKCETRPGPGDHSIRRDFDLPPRPLAQPCHAYQKPPVCFNVTSQRFIYRSQTGPGPADYDANVKIGKFRTYLQGPFGVSAKRFENVRYEDILSDDEEEQDDKKKCKLKTTYQFTSKAKRFSGPTHFDAALMAQPRYKGKRNLRIQFISPFNSSQGRFQPWHDWLALSGGLNTPGPGHYQPELPKCQPAVRSGPLCRALRFPTTGKYERSPAPNDYTVNTGVNDVLETHNCRLKENIANQHKFVWKVPTEPRYYSPLERELTIIDKAIDQLEVDKEVMKKKHDSKKEHERETIENRRRAYLERIQCVCNQRKIRPGKAGAKKPSATGAQPVCLEEAKDKIERLEGGSKQKLLRTFLYNHPQPQYI